ncbi:hypothetical protein GCM10018965_041500 [Nonomuraea roseola]
MAAAESILASTWPLRTRSPAFTDSAVTLPCAPNDRSRLEPSLVLPAAETAAVTVPRWAAASRTVAWDAGSSASANSTPVPTSAAAATARTPVRTYVGLMAAHPGVPGSKKAAGNLEVA